jgi:hypothetical protein
VGVDAGANDIASEAEGKTDRGDGGLAAATAISASPFGTAAIGRKSCRRAAAAFASELILILMFCFTGSGCYFRGFEMNQASSIFLKQPTTNPRKLCPLASVACRRFAKINLVNFLLKIGRHRRLSSAVSRREDAAELSEYSLMQ